MTLGSLATLAILAVGIIEIPKLRHTSAQENGQGDGTAATIPVVEAPNSSATPAPPVPTADSTAPLNPSTPTSPTETHPTDVSKPRPVIAQVPNPAPPVETPRPTPVPGTPAPAPSPVRPSPEVKSPVEPAPAAPDPNRARLNELRQQYNSLSIRASTAKEGLGGLQQQMQRQGLNLRADMREAQTRMDYQLKEAMESIQRGDTEQASKDLEMARYAVESIEKFLGR